MWKRISSLLVLLSLALCLLTLGACDEEERLMEHFPEWEEVEGDLTEAIVEPSIELEFRGIDFEAYTSTDGKLVYDRVLVNLKNMSDKKVLRKNNFQVLYLYKGKWYFVYSTGEVDLLNGGYYGPKTNEDISFLTPTGLFDVSGQYKLYYHHTGFCDIDILFSPDER